MQCIVLCKILILFFISLRFDVFHNDNFAFLGEDLSSETEMCISFQFLSWNGQQFSKCSVCRIRWSQPPHLSGRARRTIDSC